MGSKEIFILEDDVGVRETLSIFLERAGYQPIAFADGDALLASARQRYPAFIVLDLVLPGKSGLEVLSNLQKEDYPAPIFVISGHGNIDIAVKALKMGAADFIEKPFRPHELLDRMESMIVKPSPSAGAPTNNYRRFFAGWKVLTRRERDVLDQILAGKTTKEISRRLGLSPRTIEDHRASIMKKAKVKSATQLLLMFLEPRQPGMRLDS